MKPFYWSKTFWVNFLTLAAGVVAILMASDVVSTNPKTVAILGTIVLPVINLFLRWLTDKPITSVHPAFDQLRGK